MLVLFWILSYLQIVVQTAKPACFDYGSPPMKVYFFCPIPSHQYFFSFLFIFIFIFLTANWLLIGFLLSARFGFTASHQQCLEVPENMC